MVASWAEAVIFARALRRREALPDRARDPRASGHRIAAAVVAGITSPPFSSDLAVGVVTAGVALIAFTALSLAFNRPDVLRRGATDAVADDEPACAREPVPLRDPVFLVGSERSGTTLLRLMLDHHPEIAFDKEADFMVTMVSDAGVLPSPETVSRVGHDRPRHGVRGRTVAQLSASS